MPKDYKPPKDAAEVFSSYKTHYEGERTLKPSMRKMAERELKAGATVGQLARLTGLTPEVFRRMARDLGVEHKRPPTVGKLSSTATHSAAAPRRQVTQAVRRPVPAISPRVLELPLDRVAWLVDKAETVSAEWVEGIRQEYPHLQGPDLDYLIVDLGHQKGFKIPELDDLPPAEPASRPVTAEEAAEFAALARSRADEMQLQKLEQLASFAAEGSKDFAVMHAGLDMGLLAHDEVYAEPERPAGSEETSA